MTNQLSPETLRIDMGQAVLVNSIPETFSEKLDTRIKLINTGFYSNQMLYEWLKKEKITS